MSTTASARIFEPLMSAVISASGTPCRPTPGLSARALRRSYLLYSDVPVLKNARYLSLLPGTSAVQTIRSPSWMSWRLFEELQRPVVELGHVRAEDERGPRDRPQREAQALFVVREVGRTRELDDAEREHVGVRPGALDAVGFPAVQAPEHAAEGFPAVPEVVGDAPHIGVFVGVRAVLDRGVAGGEAEDDRAAALVDGLADAFDLGGGVWAGQVVDLDEVESPLGELLEHGIIVFLRAGFAHVHAVHVLVPRAGTAHVHDVLRVVVRALHLRILADRLTRDAAHEVHADLQAAFVHVVGERLQALAVLRGRETFGGGDEAAVFVHGERVADVALESLLVVVVPLVVNHEDVPAERLQLFDHGFRLFLRLRLGEAEAEAVEAVPAHRRGRSPVVEIGRGERGGCCERDARGGERTDREFHGCTSG